MTDAQMIDAAVFVLGLLIFGFSSKRLFRKTPKYEPGYEPVMEDDDVNTTAIYDNAGANELLDAKMKVLEWAIELNRPHTDAGNKNSAKDVAETARIWWDFIALKPDDDSDE